MQYCILAKWNAKMYSIFLRYKVIRAYIGYKLQCNVLSKKEVCTLLFAFNNIKLLSRILKSKIKNVPLMPCYTP